MNVHDIKRAAAQHFDVAFARIDATDNLADVVAARHIAMLISRDHLGLSYPVIGRRFKRDHTTVMHAVKKTAKCILTDAKLFRSYKLVLGAAGGEPLPSPVVYSRDRKYRIAV